MGHSSGEVQLAVGKTGWSLRKRSSLEVRIGSLGCRDGT